MQRDRNLKMEGKIARTQHKADGKRNKSKIITRTISGKWRTA